MQVFLACNIALDALRCARDLHRHMVFFLARERLTPRLLLFSSGLSATTLHDFFRERQLFVLIRAVALEHQGLGVDCWSFRQAGGWHHKVWCFACAEVQSCPA